LLSGWGRTAPTRATVYRVADAAAAARLLAQAGPRGAVPRGVGRAYGDAAQNAGGLVLDTTALSRLDTEALERGVVTADAGLTIGELARRLVPRGWFLPVVPGTRHVTLGGAIAADIHGKNHHRDGSVSAHLLALDLLTPNGACHAVGPDREPDAFWATAGGMGLTGLVLRGTVRLLALETAWMRVDTERAKDLDDALARLARHDRHARYSVAWIDLLATASGLGRAVIQAGEHAHIDDLPPAGRRDPLAPPRGGARLIVPPWLPPGLLRPLTMRTFNELWFRHAPREERGRLEPLESFFWPLDRLGGWNLLYGPRGFVQYQLVVPSGRVAALRAVIEHLHRARCASALGVLKRLGPGAGGPLSFPLEGWTLTLDIPAAAPHLARVLDGLDTLVAESGGRVYLAKDARLRPDALATMYPRLPEWRRARMRLDPVGIMRSDLGRRLGLT
jgi:decaprenylphospho-beta-D-ribofuranose 2-oxidase